MGRMQQLYDSLPVPFQHAAISAYGWHWRRLRLGGVFESRLRDWLERESWSAGRLADWQAARLHEVLLKAWDSTPLYRGLWERAGLSRPRLERLGPADLPLLPVVSKDQLRAVPGGNWSGGLQGREVEFRRSTSGSTGTPLTVGYSRAVWQDIWAAVEARAYRWAGVSIRQRRSTIGLRQVVSPARTSPPFWRYNIFEHQLYLSLLHLSPASVRLYRDALASFRPVTMTGYSSAQGELARLIAEAGLTAWAPRAVLATSDALDEPSRALMQKVFGAPVHQTYGLVENCAFAGTCGRGSLHLNPDFGIVEVLREDGSPCAPGETGRLVATGLVNTTSLFVRYDTGDLGVLSGRACPCGRDAFPVLERLVGRVEDVVTGANGVRLRRFDRFFTDWPQIRRAQVIQESPALVRVLLERSGVGADDCESQIAGRIALALGGLRVEVESVERIPLPTGGKFRAVIVRSGAGAQPGRES
ncbi:hypothetical protein LLH00_06485 [bacterium]|nr:hypothetical protein [bacterium]